MALVTKNYYFAKNVEIVDVYSVKGSGFENLDKA
jgi:hypothetical protein